MIEGTVNAHCEAVIALPLLGPAGRVREIEVVIGTGYNGFLTLPPDLVAELELPLVGTSQATLANGDMEDFNVHDVTVLWDGMPRDIEADGMGVVPLVGMALLDGHNLNIAVADGGRVVIEAMA